MDIEGLFRLQGELIAKVHKDVADLHESAWRAFQRADLEKMLKNLESQRDGLSDEIERSGAIETTLRGTHPFRTSRAELNDMWLYLRTS